MKPLETGSVDLRTIRGSFAFAAPAAMNASLVFISVPLSINNRPSTGEFSAVLGANSALIDPIRGRPRDRHDTFPKRNRSDPFQQRVAKNWQEMTSRDAKMGLFFGMKSSSSAEQTNPLLGLRAGPAGAKQSVPLQIPVEDIVLDGELTISPAATGVVLFAHGSGSSRHSPRNQLVARTLQEAGLASLLFDLLTSDEETQDADGHLRFNIEMLAGRLAAATRWIASHAATRHLGIG
jgi:hypothetical protein